LRFSGGWVLVNRHSNGTICLEGTSTVAEKFAPCCEDFAGHLIACVFDFRYEWWKNKQIWVIVISESAGGGGIQISFCPHCGKKLLNST
jgi:hypothetical protein